jgi:hypothetical protein
MSATPAIPQFTSVRLVQASPPNAAIVRITPGRIGGLRMANRTVAARVLADAQISSEWPARSPRAGGVQSDSYPPAQCWRGTVTERNVVSGQTCRRIAEYAPPGDSQFAGLSIAE